MQFRECRQRAIKLIRAYLNAGVMIGGLISPTTQGVPWGSLLSPFLSNVVLARISHTLCWKIKQSVFLRFQVTLAGNVHKHFQESHLEYSEKQMFQDS